VAFWKDELFLFANLNMRAFSFWKQIHYFIFATLQHTSWFWKDPLHIELWLSAKEQGR